MKQGFAVWLIIGGIFALWLYNTGRVAAFKSFVVNAPGQATLPGTSGGNIKLGATGPGHPSAQKLAQCAAQADAGVVTADCAGAFMNALKYPGDTISGAVSSLTFGIVKL